MTVTGQAVAEQHTDWLRQSPAARALARHGIDWAAEPRVPMTIVWMPEELPADDMKIRPAIVLYGGAVDIDELGARIVRFDAVPPVLADTLMWDQDEYCGWAILE